MNRCGRVPWILRSDSSSGKWQVKGKKPTVEEEARNPRAGLSQGNSKCFGCKGLERSGVWRGRGSRLFPEG